MNELYEKSRAVAEAAASRWERFSDTIGVEWLARQIAELASPQPPAQPSAGTPGLDPFEEAARIVEGCARNGRSMPKEMTAAIREAGRLRNQPQPSAGDSRDDAVALLRELEWSVLEKRGGAYYYTHEIRLLSIDGTLLSADPINFLDKEARKQMLLIRGIPEAPTPFGGPDDR